MNRGKYFIVLLLISSSLMAQEIPVLLNGYLVFSGSDKRVNIGTYDLYHVFKVQECVVYIKQEKKPNYFECTLFFYDFYGKEISRSDKLSGEFNIKFIDDNSRILVGQRAHLIRKNESYLFNARGNLINVLSHDYETKEIGITGDNKYFYFVSNKMRPLKDGEIPLYPNFAYTAYNHILFFNAGNGLQEKEYSVDGTNLDAEINGYRYTLEFSVADIPG
ncbi:hypothetical protein FACS189450_14430 [Spirochaetia bacterium]|nr:hypothetical protein FACS189450_14430 [Spirochaetia bacterium]